MILKVLLKVLDTASTFTDANAKSFSAAFNDVIGWVYAAIGGIAAAVLLTWGVLIGVKFLTAQGDEKKVKEAKDALKHYVMGIIIILIIAAVAPLLVSTLWSFIETGLKPK
jgi:uncharacterized YccA/Bax inhibitor family protein